MTEQRNQLAALFAACWKDEALKARFMSDPKAVLAEHGIDVPANINVNVVENTDNTVHITMPQVPAGAEGELTDEELASAAGGKHNATDACPSNAATANACNTPTRCAQDCNT
jgi:hypothetical protein